ncbi:MAG: glycosyltransferase family 4 protein [Paludibacteraceae bacterium]|nr:glycosyltransferase family 4 protein [Paludibacteraceae bacterium]
MKNILIIAYYFPPSGGSGVQRWLKFVKYLPQFGYRPIVLTVDPTTASYPQTDESLLKEIPQEAVVVRCKTHEIYGLYKRLTGEKQLPSGGVPKPKKKSLLHEISLFIRGNFFLPDPRRGWNKTALKQAKRLIAQYDIETVITTSPPHSTQLIGRQLKKAFPALRWIADFRDPWTDIFYYNELHPTRLADAINRCHERKVLEECDRVLVTCPTAARTFASKSDKIDISKFTVITNGYDENDVQTALEGWKPTPNNKLTISYLGVINLVNRHELDGLFTALRNYAQTQSVCLRFIGQSTEKIAPLIPDDLQSHIQLTAYLPHNEALRAMAESDVLLMVSHQGNAASAVIQAKLFEYLAVGKPILCLSDTAESDTAQIIRDCKAGTVLKHNDIDGIGAFLSQAHRLPPSLREHIESFGRKHLCQQLVKVLD